MEDALKKAHDAIFEADMEVWAGMKQEKDAQLAIRAARTKRRLAQDHYDALRAEVTGD